MLEIFGNNRLRKIMRIGTKNRSPFVLPINERTIRKIVKHFPKSLDKIGDLWRRVGPSSFHFDERGTGGWEEMGFFLI